METKMNESNTEIIDTLRKIQGLLELLAEDKIAQRDAKHRDELRTIVGNSVPKQKSVLLMDGTRTQKQIREVTSANQGHLSAMVGRLQKAGLLKGDTLNPHLAISIPASFFEEGKNAK
jgi:hypothetical protein